ncbi:MAG: FixH family protein [Mediterranea sp.]|jgi:hypothetical protein|nr:FixH family protein [Mediterranea sp.]
MKQIYIYKLFISAVLFLSFLLVSCGKDETPAASPVAGLTKIQEFTDANYTVTAWNEAGQWRLGYTKVYFTVQNKNGDFVEDAGLTAFPEMDMGMGMRHSTPRSEITKVAGKPLYEAYYSFLMYSGQGDGTWYYDLSYTTGSAAGSFDDVVIDVKNAFRLDGNTPRKVIQTVVAADGSGKRYVISLVEPQHPAVGSNEITVYVHGREDANTYPEVAGFKLKLDPRMPSMENHSSPNNEDLSWDSAGRVYRGRVNFSMTGYWKLNLILQNSPGETLYGNAVTDDIEASSLFFEVEF